MQEYTVVRQLMIASSQIHCLDKSSLDICYRGRDRIIKWVSSNYKSKDDMVSLLFDLSLLGYYVSSVRTVKFSFEYSIQLNLSKSDKLRTNVRAKLMEQVSKLLDKVS